MEKTGKVIVFLLILLSSGCFISCGTDSHSFSDTFLSVNVDNSSFYIEYCNGDRCEYFGH